MSRTAAPAGAPAAPPRPRVIVKWAQTLDGRAAAADGSSQWITGVAARADVHERRAAADAIMVGTGTLLADNPALTARGADGELLVPAAAQPFPVVVGKREIPAGSRVLAHPALGASAVAWGASPIRLPGDDLASELAHLATLGITSVFVEGGPALASSLMREGLADEFLIYIAPALLGGSRLAVGDIGATSIADITRLDIRETVQLGTDLLVIATPAARTSTPVPSAPKENA